MRSFNEAAKAYLGASNKEPRFVIQISYSGSSADDVYVVSHAGITFSGSPTILAARVESLSALSQQIFPDEGRSTIGSMSFDATDTTGSLTSSQRTNLLTSGRGLRFKTVKFWLGFYDQVFADFSLYATQMLMGVSYDAGLYSFSCSDVQRATKDSVFNRVVLRLGGNLTITDTTIPISGDTAQIVAIAHDAAWSDAPSVSVAYIQIGDEIIRIPVAGIVANQFTGVTRGALGTTATAHETDLGAVVDKRKAVTEVIFLEMNAIKLAYAVLTGDLIGQGGAVMPPTWHAGVATSLVNLTSFTAIGSDLYDGTAAGGVRLRFINPTPGEAKRWVEQQVCTIFGCYLFVQADGQLALKRLEEVLHAASPVGTISDREITEVPVLKYDYNRIQNQLEVQWNMVDKESTRITRISDQASITTWGASPIKILKAEGLHGQIHSADALRQYFQRYRSRYAGPPLITRVKTTLAAAIYEVGDIVMVRTATAVDHTDPVTTVGLLRSFEIQGTTVNWLEGTLTLDLFGSTQKAAALTRENTGQAIADSWFTSGGTDIESLGHTSRVGSIVTWNSTGSFTGNASLASAILRCNGDLIIGVGVRLDITQNVQLRVKGVLTVNGEIRGIGTGLAGIADTLNTAAWPVWGTPAPNDVFHPWLGVTQQIGTAGYYGSPIAGGGILERTKDGNSGVGGSFQSFYPLPTAGVVNVVPTYVIGHNGTIVTGIPDDLRGSSGGPGGRRRFSEHSAFGIEENVGGTGGNGGAGLLVVCRGMAFGASGKVDLSGLTGTIGGYDINNVHPAHAGAGAGGAPGALLVIVDGVLNPIPVLSNTTVPATYGAVPLPAGTYNVMKTAWLLFADTQGHYGTDIPNDRLSFYGVSPTSSLLAGVAASRALYLSAVTTPGTDTPPPPVPSLANLLPQGYYDNEILPASAYLNENGSTISFDAAQKQIGSRSIKVTGVVSSSTLWGVAFTSITSYYNLYLEPNRRFLVTASIRCNQYCSGFADSMRIDIVNNGSAGDSRVGLALSPATDTWTRVAWILDPTPGTNLRLSIGFTNPTGVRPGTPIFWIDAVQMIDVTSRPEITVTNFPTTALPATGIQQALATNAETITGTDNLKAVTPAALAAKVATTTASGIAELATSAETITGTDTVRAVTPAGLAAKVASATAQGVVELATSAEVITGTDTTRAITPAGLVAGLRDTSHLLVSSEQAWAQTGSVAHGLSVVPDVWQVVARCITAQFNFVADDEVSLVSFGDSSNINPVVFCNATNWGWAFNAGTTYYSPGKTGGSWGGALTAANWKIVFRAYYF